MSLTKTLTLWGLNCLKRRQHCFRIYFDSLTYFQCRSLKSILKEDDKLSILCNKCQGCWWPGIQRSHGINSHAFDLACTEYSIACRNCFHTQACWWIYMHVGPYIEGLVQERHNSSAFAMELHLSCINPLISCVLKRTLDVSSLKALFKTDCIKSKMFYDLPYI